MAYLGTKPTKPEPFTADQFSNAVINARIMYAIIELSRDFVLSLTARRKCCYYKTM